jgi:hypothetical protein
MQQIQIKYALIPLFASVTGYSVKACQRKIEDGVWIQGVHYRKSPDGRIHIDMNAYYAWVSGEKLAA